MKGGLSIRKKLELHFELMFLMFHSLRIES
jgi:hypothetical protein